MHAGRHSIVILTAILLALTAGSARADTHTAASASQADVRAALDAAKAGDTILVPAGTATWNGMAIDKAVHLKGAGAGQTRVTVSGNTVTKQAAGVIRVSDFTFTRSGGGNGGKGFHIRGSWRNAKPVVFQDNEFTIAGTGLFQVNVAGGVIFAGNSFTGGWDDSFIQFSGAEDTANSWGLSDSMGVRDADGTMNAYIEDNTFHGGTNQGIDADFGGRVVCRHNTFTYSSFNTHGFATSPVGVRHFEVYGNTWVHNGGTSQLANQNWAIWIRGGTGVIFGNHFDDLSGSYWGNKTEIKLSIRGAEDAPPPGTTPPVPYPVPRQIGQGHDGTRYVTDPIYIWGNTGTAAVGAGWNWGNPYNLNFNDYFQWGRDGFKDGTAKPSYSSYAYPHPLRVSPSGTVAPSITSHPQSETVTVGQTATFSVVASGTAPLTYQWQKNGANVAGATSASYTTPATTAADNGASYRVVVSNSAGSATSVGAMLEVLSSGGGASPLPEGNSGIAASYPGDAGIQGHSSVLFADDFESYSGASQLTSRWSEAFHLANIRIATESTDVFSGGKALEFKLPLQSAETSNELVKYVQPSEDVLFVRYYAKFDTDFRVDGSGHNGAVVKAKYSNPGVPADGVNKFYVGLENSRMLSASEASPGFSHLYLYHPEQRDVWGDHWYPDGTVLPFSSIPGDFGSSFVPRPNFTPQLGRWYCYEVMVKANSPGQRDGRLAFWVDGTLIADYPNVRLRDVNTLKIDKFELQLYAKTNTSRENRMWYDNVVASRSYVGPLSAVAPAVPPSITAQPVDQTVTEGQTTTFSVTATGTAPLSYQWQKDGASIPGASGASYTTPPASLSDSGSSFRVVVSNAAGAVTSSVAGLTVVSSSTGGEKSLWAPGVTPSILADPDTGSVELGVKFRSDVDGVIVGIRFYKASSNTGTHVGNLWTLEGSNLGRVTFTNETASGWQWANFASPVPIQAGRTYVASYFAPEGRYSADNDYFLGRRVDNPPLHALADGEDGGNGVYVYSSTSAFPTDTWRSRNYWVDVVFKAASPTGTGLWGQYYDNKDFTNLKVTRTDPTVDFNWGSGSPAAGMGADTFSVRWTGHLQVPTSGTYTFFTVSDDGVRLWVDGQLVINNWADHAPTENSGTIALTGGQKYSLRLEYYENGGGAVAKLLWSGPGMAKQVIPQAQISPATTSASGLTGQYYDDMDFTNLKATRTDATVDFDWGSGAPASGMGADTFSVRWTGQVEAPVSGTYTFYTISDDGVRLWVNGQLVVNNWTDHAPMENSGTIVLTGGQKYSLKMEYYENGGGAVARLHWSGPGMAKQVIPQAHLYPATPPASGLTGQYYDNMDFTNLKVTRTDVTVDFDWGSGAPASGMGADTFSVRWTGQVEAPVSGTYTFYTISDDGVRLWVNGQLVVNNWTNHAPTENSGTIVLTGGQKYSLKMEYYENGGGAVARLHWSGPGIAKQVIPQARLVP